MTSQRRTIPSDQDHVSLASDSSQAHKSLASDSSQAHKSLAPDSSQAHESLAPVNISNDESKEVKQSSFSTPLTPPINISKKNAATENRSQVAKFQCAYGLLHTHAEDIKQILLLIEPLLKSDFSQINAIKLIRLCEDLCNIFTDIIIEQMELASTESKREEFETNKEIASPEIEPKMLPETNQKKSEETKAETKEETKEETKAETKEETKAETEKGKLVSTQATGPENQIDIKPTDLKSTNQIKLKTKPIYLNVSDENLLIEVLAHAFFSKEKIIFNANNELILARTWHVMANMHNPRRPSPLNKPYEKGFKYFQNILAIGTNISTLQKEFFNLQKMELESNRLLNSKIFLNTQLEEKYKNEYKLFRNALEEKSNHQSNRNKCDKSFETFLKINFRTTPDVKEFLELTELYRKKVTAIKEKEEERDNDLQPLSNKLIIYKLPFIFCILNNNDSQKELNDTVAKLKLKFEMLDSMEVMNSQKLSKITKEIHANFINLIMASLKLEMLDLMEVMNSQKIPKEIHDKFINLITDTKNSPTQTLLDVQKLLKANGLKSFAKKHSLLFSELKDISTKQQKTINDLKITRNLHRLSRTPLLSTSSSSSQQPIGTSRPDTLYSNNPEEEVNDFLVRTSGLNQSYSTIFSDSYSKIPTDLKPSANPSHFLIEEKKEKNSESSLDRIIHALIKRNDDEKINEEIGKIIKRVGPNHPNRIIREKYLFYLNKYINIWNNDEINILKDFLLNHAERNKHVVAYQEGSFTQFKTCYYAKETASFYTALYLLFYKDSEKLKQIGLTNPELIAKAIAAAEQLAAPHLTQTAPTFPPSRSKP